TRPMSHAIRRQEPGSDIPAEFTPAPAGRDFEQIEAMIPMRDGVHLYTAVYSPKTAGPGAPILLMRTPYGVHSEPHGPYPTPRLGASFAAWLEEVVGAGYILAFQDVRGKFKSEGDYVMYRAPDEGLVDHVTDTWDSVEWLIRNVPGTNGRVGILGVSYPGYLSWIPLLNPHPAVHAVVPINAVVDAWKGDDFYHNGAFRLLELEYYYRQTTSKDNAYRAPYGHYDVFAFYLEAGNAGGAMRRLMGDAPLPVWDRLATHATYDATWQQRALDLALARLDRLPVPTLNVHAWFDAEDNYGAVAAHRALAGKPGADYHFVAGPWKHGQCLGDGSGAGKIHWDADTSLWFRRNVLLPFLDKHLRAIEPAAPLPPIAVFETGANQWRTPSAWPPEEGHRLALNLDAHGRLSIGTAVRAGTDRYVSDPLKPVPFRVRPIVSRHRDYSSWGEWLLDDQRPVADRPDVLVYTSDELDAPLTIAGGVTAILHASTTGTDADWIVKLIDLYPDEYPRQPELGGNQLMISSEVFRGRFRQSFEEAAPIEPGAVLEYTIRMPHAYHTFLSGHRLMVQIHSTWFPLYDRNPQTFVEAIHEAPPDAYQAATQVIHRGGRRSSRIEVRALA
ncbi:MAG TPA: CocE/NonD family hydrolase, partial [Candidatus Limnocylindrales bacterium]|nr:CocE/NonD family hydrolase [Candidatus Limnocylindrales bacterium]